MQLAARATVASVLLVVSGARANAQTPDTTRHIFPIQFNDRVQAYVDLFSQRRRDTFTLWFTRMAKYRAIIEERLADEGLPRELVYVPLIESGYDANAGSYAGAAGLWQFTKGTARSEGLHVSDSVDERRDPIRSTDAAVQHWKRLYDQFGSWYLAAAAYNCGSTRIVTLLRQRGYAMKAGDDAYWAIQDELPKETRDYVPMLLGAVIVGENADSFGIRVR